MKCRIAPSYLSPWARAQRFIILWCILFGSVTFIHVCLIIYCEKSVGVTPPILSFGNIELIVLCFLIPPACNTAATLFKSGGRGVRIKH